MTREAKRAQGAHLAGQTPGAASNVKSVLHDERFVGLIIVGATLIATGAFLIGDFGMSILEAIGGVYVGAAIMLLIGEGGE